MMPLLRKLVGLSHDMLNNRYCGDRGQSLRSSQIELLRQYTQNETFISRYPELLTCNESYVSIADKYDVSKEIACYFELAREYKNYGDVSSLEEWVDSKGHVYPNVHVAHHHVVETCRLLSPGKVCEIGAGSGVVSKYVYAASEGKVALTSVEWNRVHLEQMKRNFTSESRVIAPSIDVRADIVQEMAQALPFEDNSFDLVYTCTVMMHMPFIAGVLAACEIARVASRYVLHVEGYHTDGITCMRSPENLLIIDYERLYRKLGFRRIKKIIYQDPYCPEYDYIVYLGEKL